MCEHVLFLMILKIQFIGQLCLNTPRKCQELRTELV